MGKLTFYHATNKLGWEFTKLQGFLLYPRDYGASPCVYLAKTRKQAEEFGNIILRVKYDPTINPTKNNYEKSSWQVRVYEPIPMKDIEYIYEKPEFSLDDKDGRV